MTCLARQQMRQSALKRKTGGYRRKCARYLLVTFNCGMQMRAIKILAVKRGKETSM